MDKELRKVLDEAERQGFTVQRTKRGHVMVRDANNVPVTTFSGSASDSRSLRNGIAQLRRAGFAWPR